MILFRADGNTNIGVGHVMRCLSIADAMKRRGEESVFVTSDDTYFALITGRGYKCEILGSDYRDYSTNGVGLKAFEKLICELMPCLLVVDSYFVTKEWFESVSKSLCEYGGKLVYMDDYGDADWNVDAIVNYNIYATKKSSKHISGAEYAPIREMFVGLSKRKQPLECKKILISTGGADMAHVGIGLIKRILSMDTCEYKFDFLVGSANPDLSEIEELIGKDENGQDKSERITLFKSVSDMKSVILDCDVAISASGSTLYELCACGVPTVTYAMADNQLKGNKAFGELGLMVSVGDVRDVDDTPGMIMNAAFGLCEDYEKREEMGERMQKLIDGKGADRLAERLLGLN